MTALVSIGPSAIRCWVYWAGRDASERSRSRHRLERVHDVRLDQGPATRSGYDLPGLLGVEAEPHAFRGRRVPDRRLPVDDHLEFGAIGRERRDPDRRQRVYLVEEAVGDRLVPLGEAGVAALGRLREPHLQPVVDQVGQRLGQFHVPVEGHVPVGHHGSDVGFGERHVSTPLGYGFGQGRIRSSVNRSTRNGRWAERMRSTASGTWSGLSTRIASAPRARASPTKSISGCDRSNECGYGCRSMPRSRQYWSMLRLSSWYRWLLQTTNEAGTPCRTAVHSAWYVYMLPPSPAKPTTARSGCAIFMPTAPGNPTPSDPPRVRK